MLKLEKLISTFLIFIPISAHGQNSSEVRIGSKTFTESYLLAELFAQSVEEKFLETPVQRKLGIGGTGVLYNSLKANEIDFYPEYTGTISEAILKNPKLKNLDAIRDALKKENLIVSNPIGFNNTYAFAMRQEQAKKLGIEKISDLKQYANLKAGFSYEFMERSDGFRAVTSHYGIELPNARGIEHSLAYPAIENKAIDLMVVYSTDAKIKQIDLKVLEDDRNFFPRYEAVILARKEFVDAYPKIWKSLNQEFVGKISAEQMRSLNALVDIDGKSFTQAVQVFRGTDLIEKSGIKIFGFSLSDLLFRLKEHLYLVLVSVFLSIVAGVPLGILAFRSPHLAQSILGISGIIQTIPSLALLCFFIPFFGIGVTPALIALFLYALLPIVRSTYVGLSSLDPGLREVSHIIGLSDFQRLLWIELPLSSESILSGIKTSTIINVGTATLAAFIGAGGLGSFIVTGLALNNIPLILYGAIPAALLAILFQIGFAICDRILVPKGLQIRAKI